MSLDTDSHVSEEIETKIFRKMFDMKHRGTKRSRLDGDGVEGLV